MILGNQLEDLFEKLFSTLSSFSNTVSSATGISEVGEAATTMLEDIEKIQTDMLPKILSDTVYITENISQELSSISDVDGENEVIITGGFRG
jgi:hypothetical protein